MWTHTQCCTIDFFSVGCSLTLWQQWCWQREEDGTHAASGASPLAGLKWASEGWRCLSTHTGLSVESTLTNNKRHKHTHTSERDFFPTLKQKWTFYLHKNNSNTVKDKGLDLLLVFYFKKYACKFILHFTQAENIVLNKKEINYSSLNQQSHRESDGLCIFILCSEWPQGGRACFIRDQLIWELFP